MNFMKKQTAGSGITFVAFVLSIAAIIVYFVNINSVGYFENAAVPEAVLYNVIGIVLLAVILVLSQLPLSGIVDKLLTIVSDIMRICAPVFFISALLRLVSSRVQGFAFIYFSIAPSSLADSSTASETAVSMKFFMRYRQQRICHRHMERLPIWYYSVLRQ